MNIVANGGTPGDSDKHGTPSVPGDDVDGAAIPAGIAANVSAIPTLAAQMTEEGEDEARELELAPEDESTTAPPPPIIADLTAACVRFVQGKYGVPLDFTSDTLSLVDQYVRDARAEIAILPQSLDLLAGSIGAYFGEVCRRTFGGVWVADGATSTYRLCFTRVHLLTNPIGVGHEAVLVQPEPSFHAHFAVEMSMRGMVDERLRMLPSVDEGEYYLPSTRFDVLALVFEVVRAQMIAEGRSAARFTPVDYRL